VIEAIAADFLSHWPLESPVNIRPVGSGVNNLSHLITSGAESFILKQYLNADMAVRVAFEHALLAALARRGLPFAVPVPVRARDGRSVVEVEGGRYALFPAIPGRPAERGDAAIAARCGAALAALDIALAQVTRDLGSPVPNAYGRLSAEHPTVPDLSAAVATAFPEKKAAQSLMSVLARAERAWMDATAGWPRQVIHCDFFPSNVLIEEGAVSGVLDFEFAGLGERAMDLAIGLVAFSSRTWEAGWRNGPDWPLLDAFAGAYLATLTLTERELAAMPDLILMREAGSFVHWLGRLGQGLTTREDIEGRAERLHALNGWLNVHREDLVGCLNRVAGEPRSS
jgi:homoserine kinase type II